LSLSMTYKAVGFDRPMPETDFDTLDLPPTGTQPTGIPGAARHGGARNRQAPGNPSAAARPDSRPLAWTPAARLGPAAGRGSTRAHGQTPAWAVQRRPQLPGIITVVDTPAAGP
jgi:hypothetical protein